MIFLCLLFDPFASHELVHLDMVLILSSYHVYNIVSIYAYT
ncbi:hypothetical protein Hanom_Chr09g00832501 [Helianthus anomalus]